MVKLLVNGRYAKGRMCKSTLFREVLSTYTALKGEMFNIHDSFTAYTVIIIRGNDGGENE